MQKLRRFIRAILLGVAVTLVSQIVTAFVNHLLDN